MNDKIIKEISDTLNINIKNIEAVLNLLKEGNTVPFIARYRKEVTGAMDEEAIRQVEQVYEYSVNLEKRKEDVIRLIDEKGLLTDDIKKQIDACLKLVEVEDIYRPFKEKKKTKATEAIQKGLEPLAKMMMSFPTTGSLEKLVTPFIKEDLTLDTALEGARYIIAEWISDNASYRKWIRNKIYHLGTITSKIKKNAEDTDKVYEMYYDYQEQIRNIKPHRILAMNRGEKEKILTVSIVIDEDQILSFLEHKLIKNDKSFVVDEVKSAIKDSYKRLIFPSVEREVRSELSLKAEDTAIDNFGDNLEKLLLTPPMKERIVLGFDPAYRTGCKLAVVDKTGKPLKIEVIYPHEPKNEIEKSEKILLDLIDKYKIDIIAIGNGTASRESEAFVANTIKKASKKVEYIIVSEAGASVYSASPLAISEFPDLTVEKRSAISIARRLQDPLAELVKIDPESIGVGLYQHDVTSKKLHEALDFVVTKTVNQVGVSVNTASPALLKYVSGMNKRVIDKIINYRNEFGPFKSRDEFLKKKLFTEKVYEQAIGFLRIPDGNVVLDNTSIHPESYKIAYALLKTLNLEENVLGTSELINILDNIDLEKMAKELNTDIYTLEDIIASFKAPGRDLRDSFEKPLLKVIYFILKI